MNLLFIAPKINRRSEIKNFSGVWAWYLAKELQACGAKLQFESPLHRSGLPNIVSYYRGLDLDGIDHVLALGQGYFDQLPLQCAEGLKARCRGAVTQMHDLPRDGTSSVDCTFTICGNETSLRSLPVGWAADPELCYPNQKSDELSILIDHPDYKPDRGDRTAKVIGDVRKFVKSGIWAPFKTVRVRQIVDNGVIEFDGKDRPFHREHILYENICAEYSKTHIFLVTHPESVGLTVLETAMAGALPIVFEGAIREDRLRTIRHKKYRDAFSWAQVIGMIDVEASREIAKHNSWRSIAERIISYFVEFQRA